MDSLAQLFKSHDVLLDVDAADKHALFSATAQLWQQHYGLDAGKIVANLETREKLGSTGLGEGVAIPHARIDGLNKALVALVRTNTPIAFDAFDGKPVALFFMLLVPPDATEQHLQILVEVAEMFSDEAFRANLGAARSSDEMLNLFATGPVSALRKSA